MVPGLRVRQSDGMPDAFMVNHAIGTGVRHAPPIGADDSPSQRPDRPGTSPALRLKRHPESVARPEKCPLECQAQRSLARLHTPKVIERPPVDVAQDGKIKAFRSPCRRPTRFAERLKEREIAVSGTVAVLWCATECRGSGRNTVVSFDWPPNSRA